MEHAEFLSDEVNFNLKWILILKLFMNFYKIKLIIVTYYDLINLILVTSLLNL